MPYLLVLGIGEFFLLDASSNRHDQTGFGKPGKESDRHYGC